LDGPTDGHLDRYLHGDLFTDPEFHTFVHEHVDQFLHRNVHGDSDMDGNPDRYLHRHGYPDFHPDG